MINCTEYVKEAMKDVHDESEFKNAVIHCLEVLAQEIDNSEGHRRGKPIFDNSGKGPVNERI